jgi:hypothetical protein
METLLTIDFFYSCAQSSAFHILFITAQSEPELMTKMNRLLKKYLFENITVKLNS